MTVKQLSSIRALNASREVKCVVGGVEFKAYVSEATVSGDPTRLLASVVLSGKLEDYEIATIEKEASS
jgi:hypothetical protein